ncbi:MAG: general secretion pathway protein GspK, partial [Myxococcales bacterium]|nr:general secretion pathway protein GspK [Myxococcales bacterium]
RRHRQRGLALLIVLWVGALVAVLAATFAFEARQEAALTHNAISRARAESLAESGIARAILGLLAPRADERWDDLGAPRRVALPGGTAQVSALSENGKLDINVSPPELVRGLIEVLQAESADVGDGRAADVAQAILDWRDDDQDPLPGGAEADQYAAAGLDHVPRDRAFLSVGELRLVMGMTDALFDRLAPLVTVHTWSARIDPQSAPREVLLALPGVDVASVDAFLEARAQAATEQAATGGGAASPRLPLELLRPAQRHLSRSRSRVYTLRSEGRTDDGAIARKEAVVRLSGSPRRPFSVLAWLDDRSPGGEDTAAPDDTTNPAETPSQH